MKKGLKWLLVFFTVVLVALVIALNLNLQLDVKVENILTGNGNFQNLSNSKGTFSLNATFTQNATHGNNLTNVTFMFSNMSDAYMYNVTVFNNTDNQSKFANASFDLSVLADGVYNLSINYTNMSSDSGQNISLSGSSGYNITIDNTAPVVNHSLSLSASGLPVANGSNFSASKGNVSINFTIYDSRPTSANNGTYGENLFNISIINFVFDNGTGADFNLTSANVSNLSGIWGVNYNLSSLFEGPQGVIVYVNDTMNNTNALIFNFTVDRTAPVVTASSSGVSSTAATISASINESAANCSYSVTNGAGGGSMSGSGTSYSATLTLLPSNTYTATITCTDFVGYTGTGTTTFSSSAAASTSSGGGGSGGSSGGVSTGATGSFEKKVWTSINAGETASVELENGAVGVTEVSFNVPSTVYGAWVSVAKKDSLPSSVSEFSGEVYRNLEITKGPALAKEGAFTNAVVKFKVEKAWLSEKKLTKEAVALHHYQDGKWTQLTTTVGEDDGTYVHYSAATPGFSYFVIGQKEGATPSLSGEVPAAEEPAAVEAPTEAPAEEAAAKGMSKTWLVALLAALVVVVAVVVYMRRKR